MSKTAKTILIILGLIFLCCCVIGIGGYLVVQRGLAQLSSGEFLVDDPLQIQQVVEEIPDYTLPAGYTEEYSMDFLGFAQGVFITSETKGVMITMIQFSSGIFSAMEDYQDQFQESILQQYEVDNMDLDMVDQRTVEIRGEETTVQVYEGTDTQGHSVIQWVTSFEGDNGTVIVIMVGSASTWNDAEMESFLGSIE